MKKETGLMFKAPLVRAILSGQKTQTRRIVKPIPAADQPLQYITTETGLVYARSLERIDSHNLRRIRWESPVGKPGDRIYVREAHAHHPQFPQMAFRADGEEFEDADGWRWDPKWTPAIHMKKEEARIWLEITGVRVERLQEITEGDAEREGVQLKDGSDEPYSETNRDGFRYRNYQSKEGAFDCSSARESFRSLWKSTGGDWDANPWVWVIGFKTISTTGRPA